MTSGEQTPASAAGKVGVVLEMETSDPDDFLTLLWLADHPLVELHGVIVTPGSRDQCQLVRWGLDQCGRAEVPVGSSRGTDWWDSESGLKRRVSSFHYRHFGAAVREHDIARVEDGPQLLRALLLGHPGSTVLVGAPPKTLGAVLAGDAPPFIRRVVQQGGFAGDNLVAIPLEKFRGRITSPSFNLGGAWQETLTLLQSASVARRVFVSKNVCHGVLWTSAMRDAILVNRQQNRRGLQLMVGALEAYSALHPTGKALHDLVAAACVIDETICRFREVEMYRAGGEWGANPAAGSNTIISVDVDIEKFTAILTFSEER